MCVIFHTSVCSHSWLFTLSRRIHVSVPPQPIKRFTCGLVNTETPSNTSGITDRETDSLSLSLMERKYSPVNANLQTASSPSPCSVIWGVKVQSSQASVFITQRDSLILKHVSWLYTHITEKHTLLFFNNNEQESHLMSIFEPQLL